MKRTLAFALLAATGCQSSGLVNGNDPNASPSPSASSSPTPSPSLYPTSHYCDFRGVESSHPAVLLAATTEGVVAIDGAGESRDFSTGTRWWWDETYYDSEPVLSGDFVSTRFATHETGDEVTAVDRAGNVVAMRTGWPGHPALWVADGFWVYESQRGPEGWPSVYAERADGMEMGTIANAKIVMARPGDEWVLLSQPMDEPMNWVGSETTKLLWWRPSDGETRNLRSDWTVRGELSVITANASGVILYDESNYTLAGFFPSGETIPLHTFDLLAHGPISWSTYFQRFGSRLDIDVSLTRLVMLPTDLSSVTELSFPSSPSVAWSSSGKLFGVVDGYAGSAFAALDSNNKTWVPFTEHTPESKQVWSVGPSVVFQVEGGTTFGAFSIYHPARAAPLRLDLAAWVRLSPDGECAAYGSGLRDVSIVSIATGEKKDLYLKGNHSVIAWWE